MNNIEKLDEKEIEVIIEDLLDVTDEQHILSDIEDRLLKNINEFVSQANHDMRNIDLLGLENDTKELCFNLYVNFCCNLLANILDSSLDKNDSDKLIDVISSTLKSRGIKNDD